jgi:hypothetical protein
VLDTEEKIHSEAASSSIRFLVILFVVILAGAGAFYWLLSTQKPLNTEQATAALTEILKHQRPASVQFRAGEVQASVDVKPSDPHYALLQKAGYLKVSKMTGGRSKVEITPVGQEVFAKLTGLQKTKQADGTEAYRVPLATRELVSVDKVTMTSHSTAKVLYQWKWVPNQVGDNFDTDGKLVAGFNNWDKQKLIENGGVDFYHGAPTRSTIDLIRDKGGWQILTQ